MADIDEVVLVGGSSRMPQVKNAISAKYPDANIKVFDPDQSVAKGAAIFAKSNALMPADAPVEIPAAALARPACLTADADLTVCMDIAQRTGVRIAAMVRFAAMHTALAMSLEHVVSQGKTLHPDTLAALQEYEHE